jgi:hypothetical protein
MSGGKGSQQTGSSTTSQTNPLAKYVTGAADYLTPYAQDPNRPYTAPPNPYQTQGYQDLYTGTQPNPVQTGGLYNVADTAGNVQGWPTARSYDAYGNLITGGGTSPAQPGYQQFATGTAGPQHNADIWGLQAAQGEAPNAASMVAYANQAAGGNLGLSELGKFASGGYDANPYLPAAIAAAQRPVQLAYQESTAPTTDARFSGAGRYGSGANDAARVRDESALAGSLGDISTNMSYADFKAAMDRKAAASQQYDAATRANLGLGISGIQAAGNLTDQGLRTALSAADLTQRGQVAGLAGLDTGFNRGLTTQQTALSGFPQFIQSLFAPGLATAQAGAGLSAQDVAAAQGAVNAGTGLRTLDQSMLSEPYDKVRAYLQAISGGGSAGSSSTQPIFSNPLTSAISGASGILGLGKELGVGSGLKSLFGGGAGDAATLASLGGDFGGGGTGAFVTAAAPELAAAGTGGKAAAEAAAPLVLASDRRLKEDYRVIGKVGALPLYSFRYKGDPTPRIGFMADEVEQIDPGAVHSMPGGFKAVDYERAVKSALK